MEKTCTNSACRKSFIVSASTTACPWCGKKYPRLVSTAPAPKMFAKMKKPDSGNRLVLYNYGRGKLLTVRAVRALTGLGLADTKSLVERTEKVRIIVPISCPERIKEARAFLLRAGARFRFAARRKKP